MLLRILTYLFGILGFSIYLITTYYFIECEYPVIHTENQKRKVDKKRKKYIALMILGFIFIFISGLLQ